MQSSTGRLLQMKPTTVRGSLHFLEQTDSYLGEWLFAKNSVLAEHKDFLEEVARSKPDDIVLGVYVNNTETLDCLIITNNGIFSVYKTSGQYIAFDSIQSASIPQTGDEAIDVELENKQYVTISVLGQTSSRSDIYAFHEFLKSLVNRTDSDVFDELRNVETKEDLCSLMDRHFGKESGDETRLRFENFEGEFQEQNIDPSIVQVNGFWRLMGIWRIEDALLNNPTDFDP